MRVYFTTIVKRKHAIVTRSTSATKHTYNTCIRAPRNFIVPGIHVKVVNSYAAASLFVPVNDVNKVDFPTLGKPTNPIRVSPDLVTTKTIRGTIKQRFVFKFPSAIYGWVDTHYHDTVGTGDTRTIKSSSRIFRSGRFTTRTIDQFGFQFTNFRL